MTQPISFMILSDDPASAQELRDALLADRRSRLIATYEQIEQMYTEVLRVRPSAAIITLGSNPELSFALIKRLTVAAPNTALIAAAREYSPSIILGSLRAGAREFLQLPINADEFKTVLHRIEEFCAGQQEAQPKGRVISIFSSKGGAGTSFIATNLAATINSPTLLLDLNLQAGDLDSFLNSSPRYSIADLVKNRQRLDQSLLNSFITTHSANLSFLAAPLEAHEADDIEPEYVSEIIHTLREHYSYVVLDLQHTFDPITIAALDQSDDIILVLTLDIPGIRNTKRALKIFDRIRYPREKIHIVVNRHTKQVDVELQKVERHLGGQIVGFIPNDYHKVMDSINLGQPLVQTDPASKIAAELRRIAALITGGTAKPTAEPRKGVLKTLFNRQKSSASLEFLTTLDKA